MFTSRCLGAEARGGGTCLATYLLLGSTPLLSAAMMLLLAFFIMPLQVQDVTPAQCNVS